jgi:UDP-N-acetyl-D-galactosamine dehydrogenase
VSELEEYNCKVDVYDPLVATEEAQREYGITLITKLDCGVYDAIIVAVAHTEFSEMGPGAIRALGKASSILYDLKYVLSAQDSDLRL